MKRGKNKGKKYIKLKGYEKPTPEAEARAQAFMKWYGENFEALRDELIHGHFYCDELATDAALTVYDGIALRGYKIKDYKSYYSRVYHTTRLTSLKRDKTELILDDDEYTTHLSACDFNYAKYEAIVETLNGEILDYVRGNYDEVAVSLFEIYIGLFPDTSYRRLSAMLGVPVSEIWTNIGEIRKDVAKRFGARKEYLLSLMS